MSSTGDDMDDAGNERRVNNDTQPEHDEVAEPSTSKEESLLSSDDEEREGRFYGPDSSWRHYTEQERALAASLDQAECNDLSIHLYNAHALKQQQRDSQLSLITKTWQSKRCWTKTQDNGKAPFMPHTAWTAWPLEAADVPRRREQWGVPAPNIHDDSEAYSRREGWKPSQDLRDSLKALMLRHATQRFRLRPWRDVAAESQTSMSEFGARSSSSDSSYRSSSPGDAKLESGEESDQPKQHHRKTSILQSTADVSESYNVSFMEDDDAAGRILGPSVEHVVAQLDSLLVGLHKSRVGHRRERYTSQGQTESSSRSRSRSRAQSRGRSSTKRKRAVSRAAASSYESSPSSGGEDFVEHATRKSRSQTPRRDRKHLGVRDWGEVIGMAAMRGWDQAVIDRAASRCAAIFGEKMEMRVMPDAPVAAIQDSVVQYVPDTVPQIELHSDSDEVQSDMEADDDLVDDDRKETGFACPYPDCERHILPYDGNWRLREHLKRKHKETNVDEKYPVLKTKNRKRSKQESSVPRAASVKMEAEEQSEADVLDHLMEASVVRVDGFLQPVTVRTARSTDKKKRKPPTTKKEKSSSRARDESD